MLVLGFDAATRLGVAGVYSSADGVLAEAAADLHRGAAEQLLRLVDQALGSAAVTLEQIDLIVAGIGPGSYTGLRIAAATTLGLAQASGKPTLGVPTLEAIAAGLWGTGLLVAPTLDARRGNVYTALYRCAGAPEEIRPATCVSLAIWRCSMPPEAKLLALDDPLNLPRAGALARLGLHHHQAGRQAPVEPVYLRPG